MYDIVSVGEALIDFTPFRRELSAYPVFEQNPGGAPANLAVAAAHMGAKASFLGKVGDDQFGVFLEEILQENGVCTKGMVKSKAYKTTLAFVHLSEDGQREFDFYRGADQQLQQSEVDWEMVESARIVHISSLAFCSEVTAATTDVIIAKAKEAGVLISYDANWRPMLWEDHAEGKRLLAKGNSFADIIKASEDELESITGLQDEQKAVNSLLGLGVKMVLVTHGSGGSAVYTATAYAQCPAFTQVKPVDTTGAGDTCFGTFLANMLRLNKPVEALCQEDLAALLRISNAAAGLSVTKRGGICSIPSAEAVAQFLEKV